MNQIIADNRHKIDTACQLCFYALDKYHKACQTFNEEKRRIAATPYIQQEQERMVNKAAETLSNAANGHYAEIKKDLGMIREAANEMEGVLDIGEDLQNTLAVVKSLGKDAPNEILWKLVEQFKGQRQALIILKTAYEAAGVNAEHYFKGTIFSASSVLDDLDEQAYRIVVQPGDNIAVAVSFGDQLEKLAESLGVQPTKKFRDIVDTSDAFNAQLLAAMGLGTAD